MCVHVCLLLCESVCVQCHEAQIEKYNFSCLSSAFICLRQGVFLINHNVCQRSWPTIFWGCSLSLSEISDMGYHAMFLICVCVLGSYNSITHPSALASLPAKPFLLTPFFKHTSLGTGFLTNHSFWVSLILRLCRWVLGLSFWKYLLLANKEFYVTVMLRIF